jgi:hypothetical protein
MMSRSGSTTNRLHSSARARISLDELASSRMFRPVVRKDAELGRAKIIASLLNRRRGRRRTAREMLAHHYSRITQGGGCHSRARSRESLLKPPGTGVLRPNCLHRCRRSCFPHAHVCMCRPTASTLGGRP